MNKQLRISVLILTKNEQQDLPGCLQSVAWSDDVHVYDSGSTDDTLAIARAHGASISQRTYPHSTAPFGGDEAAHRNWGLREIQFKHDWVLLLDADERITPHLLDTISARLNQAPGRAAFRFCRRDYFLGTWLKHVTPSPMHIRLVRPRQVHYERLINPVLVVDGEIEDLSSYFDHHPFSKGIAHWFAKHNGYSDLEARQIANTPDQAGTFEWRKALFSRDVTERRQHQKSLYYRLPLRPAIMFLGLYIGKRGFMDGRAGLVFATLRAIYEYMIVLKVTEMQSRLQQGGQR
ncbi:glycosyl transferase family 2 [Aquabacterium sp. NJ1]|uniref:glycosyltransferase family 2 protein n=1 Tax=Aquabacterium sp. NJ1 TaxID=1538295 RepID=UPI00052CCC33|nr:glycosyltransferase family 2 protein [Aquabacterium sp. NJ1]KGM40975.1 glycosyl transferase family 2 [Aquabacterium sp. NJ1]